jgi:hypothetical protein
MTLVLDEVLFNIGLVILEGLVLAILLNYWQDWTMKKKEKREMNFLIQHIYKSLFVDRDPDEVYYFVKLSGEREKMMIQQLLKLEIKEESKGGTDVRLVLKNSEFGLVLDPAWNLSHIVTYKVKIEEGKPTPQRHYFGEPPQNVQSFAEPKESFRSYFEKRAKMFGLRI